MKGGKQRRAELQARKQARAAKDAAKKKERELVAKRREGVAVNTENLVPNNSYSRPDFVQRGYYVDKEFTCHGLRTRRNMDCETAEMVVRGR